MKAEELYKKGFGDADSISKESAIRLLQHFSVVLGKYKNKENKSDELVEALEKIKDFCTRNIVSADISELPDAIEMIRDISQQALKTKGGSDGRTCRQS